MRYTYVRHDGTAGEQCQQITPLGVASGAGGAAMQQHGLAQRVAGWARRGREHRRARRTWTAQWWLWPFQQWPLE